MPMWAHYANNHRGYCIEYEIQDTKKIYPIYYEMFRKQSSDELNNVIIELYNYYKIKKKSNNEFHRVFSYVYLSLCCKNKFWEYENEYRLLYPVEEFNNIKGKTIDIKKEKLKINCIYIGYKCEEKYKIRLIEISNKLNCNICEVDFDKFGKDYKLIDKKIQFNICSIFQFLIWSYIETPIQYEYNKNCWNNKRDKAKSIGQK
eukprot:TRINITY_DN16035_c0_g1_i1.p2 TRINITY_DN16035_c0_g1~~TRINITY_DN16035_c0_g1_i1.p2  ORF type:complete len:203 (-),score=25.53 TRINITY_DN16035_c0_g1_i1:489-1097(-)